MRKWNHVAGSMSAWLPMLFLTLSISCGPRPPVKEAPSPTPATATSTPVQYPSPVIGKPYRSTGVVRIINLNEGWIEIDHKEIPELMPAMEMEFWVKDKSLFRGISVGDQVDFAVVETGKGEYLTELKKARPVK